jgi:hypothetical protein
LAPTCLHQAISCSVSGSGHPDLDRCALGAGDRCQALFPLALQRSGDKPVLGLAGVELAPCTVGLDPGALELQFGERIRE